MTPTLLTPELFFALVGFAFVTSVTPGPNNMMLLASGVNYGFARTVPHMLGITFGHSVMVFLVGLGLAGVMQGWPPAKTILKVLSVAYMLWLAWIIAHAGAPKPGSQRPGATGGRPFGFIQAAAFQWVNPKAWAMSLGAISAYAPDRSVWGVALVAGVFAAVNLPSVSLWARAGEALRGWLASPRRLRAFNWTMAALLVASLVPVLRL